MDCDRQRVEHAWVDSLFFEGCRGFGRRMVLAEHGLNPGVRNLRTSALSGRSTRRSAWFERRPRGLPSCLAAAAGSGPASRTSRDLQQRVGEVKRPGWLASRWMRYRSRRTGEWPGRPVGPCASSTPPPSASPVCDLRGATDRARIAAPRVVGCCCMAGAHFQVLLELVGRRLQLGLQGVTDRLLSRTIFAEQSAFPRREEVRPLQLELLDPVHRHVVPRTGSGLPRAPPPGLQYGDRGCNLPLL